MTIAKITIHCNLKRHYDILKTDQQPCEINLEDAKERFDCLRSSDQIINRPSLRKVLYFLANTHSDLSLIMKSILITKLVMYYSLTLG